VQAGDSLEVVDADHQIGEQEHRPVQRRRVLLSLRPNAGELLEARQESWQSRGYAWVVRPLACDSVEPVELLLDLHPTRAGDRLL
jgi:hypothetical protein